MSSTDDKIKNGHLSRYLTARGGSTPWRRWISEPGRQDLGHLGLIFTVDSSFISLLGMFAGSSPTTDVILKILWKWFEASPKPLTGRANNVQVQIDLSNNVLGNIRPRLNYINKY